MAPRKRKAEEGGEEDNGKPKTAALSTRVTRSMARGGNSGVGAPAAGVKVAANKKQQRGKAAKKDKVKETATKEAVAEEKEEEKPEAEEVEKPDAEVGPTQDEEEGEDEEKEKKKTVVVEHCKQCNSFKTRALQVKGGLEKAVPGVDVLLNPDKGAVVLQRISAIPFVGHGPNYPRRGCFEIREEGGEKFISLLDMKRPFKPMKDLNMEEVIADIVEKIKA